MEHLRQCQIKLGQAQFRLLRVHALTDDDGPSVSHDGDARRGDYPRICCSLAVFNIEDSTRPDYSAISYAWGPRLPAYTITIEGIACVIRKNLWNFLEQLARGRLPIGNTFMWIDQICIDQKSVAERNHQLGLLSKIYKEAVQVISWLGVRQDQSVLLSFQDHAYPRQALFSNRYWSRLWMAQEVMLAQEWIVLHGSVVVYENDIMEYLLSRDEREIGPATWIRQRQEHDFCDHPPELKTVLMYFAHLECEDPRDKIYALLALASNRGGVVIDYNSTAADVFWSAFALYKEEDIIGPSAIVQIARDMGVVSSSSILLDNDSNVAHEE